MKKRILIGSIIAVVILALVSFTGVVGYQTAKSPTIAKDSPLFSVRGKRAIGQVQKDITANYLGHGEETDIHFSSRMKRTELNQKAVNIISKMDDKAFSKFVARIILHLKYQERMADKETSDVLQALYYIRKNPNDMEYYDKNNIHIDGTIQHLSCHWFPGCIVFTIYIYIVRDIIEFITMLFHCFSGMPWCYSIYC